MSTNRLLRRTAHLFSRGGFTLVELLVVIGIIAILAGVALGPITNGIKKAKESAGVQEAHAIGLAMYSCANDNQQLYPDTSNPSGNTGTAAAAPAHALLAGGYVTDPAIFYISSDSVTQKYTGTAASAASTIAATAISWDFVGVSTGVGLSSVNYPSMPILWTTVGGAAVSYGSATNPITVTPTLTTLPYGLAGVAVFYENNSAAFVAPNPAGLITMVTGPNNSGVPAAPAPTPATLSGN